MTPVCDAHELLVEQIRELAQEIRHTRQVIVRTVLTAFGASVSVIATLLQLVI